MEKNELFKELQNLLDVFDSVCRKHNLQYTLFAGTLLGAIRHDGFIPWDDDLDVAMMREDYDKLISLPQSEFSDPYFLQTPSTDPGYNKAFAKLRNSNTTEIPYKDAVFNFNHGIFIDIFPYDALPESKEEYGKLLSDLESAKRLLHWTARVEGKVGTKGLDFKRKAFYYAINPLIKAKIITSEKAFNKVNQVASRYRNDKAAVEIGTLSFSGKNSRFIYKKEWFDKIISHEFESKQYPIPFYYDEVLRKSYGDYMTPVKQQSEHGETIFKTKIPYKKYIEDHMAELYGLYLKHRV